MPIPVFEQSSKPESSKPDKSAKEKVSGMTIFLSILLVVCLFVMAEFAFRDVNRVFNPYYEECAVEITVSLKSPTIIKRGQVNTDICDVEKYERAKLILHADITVPIILLSILVYLLLRGRKPGVAAKTIFISYLIFLGWILLRTIAEAEIFLVTHYPLVGKYLVIVSIVIILAFLINQIQKKIRKKLSAKEPRP
ncbi:hypothetical protein KKF61_01730 [Patescibacteria group bacterium]|nr:hypothetical protein [Patescibacteria group bacterium]MBU0964500.1 hypothetical protein [Patescibacteria group bacterium]